MSDAIPGFLRPTEGQEKAPAALAADALPIPREQEPSGSSNATPRPVGLSMTSDHWYYFGDTGPLPSVTKILSIMDKPVLVPWAKRTVAEFAVSKAAELQTMIADTGAAATAKYLAALPDYQRDTAAQLGTSVHLLADLQSRGTDPGLITEQQKPYVAAFSSFLAAHEGSSIVSSEKAVISIGDGYAGTYDLLMQMGSELWLIDIKTSKGTYPETGLQLVAYGYAESIVLPGDPTLYPMPKVDRYAVLHLRPDAYSNGWRLIEYPCTERDYVAFLGCKEVFDWKQEGRFSKSVHTK